MTRTYIQAIKQPTLGYLTRSVRRRAATSKRGCRRRTILALTFPIWRQTRHWHVVWEHDPTTAICGKFSEQIKLRGSGGWPTPWMLAPAGVDKRVLKPE